MTDTLASYGAVEGAAPLVPSSVSPPKQQQQQKRREWINFVVPMVAIVFIACVAAVITVACEHESEQDDFDRNVDSLHRNMQEIDTGVHHKPVFQEDHAPLFPLTTSDYYGVIFSIMGLVIAAGGGIGGGGILVPIYILVLGFSPKHAIPLSNVTVFGGAIANMILNVNKRHPLADRPLVDWDLILVMEPLTIAGALVGAFLNKVLPELLLTALLVALLSFTSWETLKKAISMYKKETQAMNNRTKMSELARLVAEDDESNNQAGEKLLDAMEERDEGTDEAAAQKQEQEQHNREVAELQGELAQILDEERETPRTNVTILVTLFVVVLAINILKGGGAFPSPLGIACGSTSFWAANGLMLGWILAICVFVRQYLIKRYEAKKRCGYQYVEGDIQWDERATLVYPSLCCFAGFFAGMFGVGGGIVKGPLMLAMGVHPAVSSASSACMILFTSFTATTSYIVFGLLVPDYAVVCLIVGFLATFAGQLCLNIMMKKSKRNSYIAFSIGGGVLLSAIFMSIQSLLSLAEGEHHHSGGLCGRGD